MKKLISVLLSMCMLLSFNLTACAAKETQTKNNTTIILKIGSPTMTVNGNEMPIDEQGTVPVIENNRTLLPVRAVVEQMGGSVDWNGETNEVTLTYGNDKIKLTIDSTEALLNGEKRNIDAAPTIINDRTMLPIRFIAESFGFNVEWDEKTATISITKDTPNNSATVNPDTSKGGKILVVYYSATGSTEKVANCIKNATNADIFELEPTDKYSDDDLDWTDKSSRVNAEHDDESKRDIKLKSTTVPNWKDYDTVFIGYPIWWGIAAWPVNNFVKDNDFSDKTVIPFCTSASSGLGQSGILLEKMAGTGDWQMGQRFSSGASESTVKSWVDGLGIK